MEIKKLLSFDGCELNYRHYKHSDPKGVVIYLHGIQSHSEWFASSCRFISENGYDVYAPDRRGSGLNSRARGDCPSYKALVKDVGVFVDLAKSLPGNLPVHIVGVSWGGKLAVMSALTYKDEIASIVLIVPGLVQKVDISKQEKMRVGLCSIFNPRRMFDIPINSPEMFTSNEKRLEYIRNDPLMLQQGTARLFLESFKMGLAIDKNAEKVEVPVNLLLAEKEEIVDNLKIIELFKRFGSSTKGFKLYEGMSHTLEFERNNEEFMNDVIDWLDTDGNDKKK